MVCNATRSGAGTAYTRNSLADQVCGGHMKSVAFMVTLAAGAAVVLSTVAPATAYSVEQFAATPIDGAGIDCGSVPQTAQPGMKFWNYDAAFTNCADAVAVLEGFHQARQKYATVGEWECGINGAAEADRSGILIRCVGPRGPLHALQVEAPPR